MHQESTDRMKGSALSDTVLFIILIAFFFAAGSAATFLKVKFGSNIPLYAFAVVLGALIILIYRLMRVGYRYTVFYKEPKPEFDERFNDYITHEDYPYPVGTVVVESISSAKGKVLDVINRDELVTMLEPGAEYAADEELDYSPISNKRSRSLIISRGGRTIRVYMDASDDFAKYVGSIKEA